MTTIQSQLSPYLSSKRRLVSKSKKTYQFVLQLFVDRLKNKSLEDLTHEDLSAFIDHLDKMNYAKSTIALAVTAVVGFFEWAAFERKWSGSISDIQYVAKQSKPSLIQAVPEYDQKILADLVEWASHFDQYKKIGDKRDAFLILAAASSGARLGRELCQMKRGQVDWDRSRSIVIGKGNREGKLLFSEIAVAAGQSYLKARAEMDGKSGQPLTSLPLFAQHVGNNKVKPLGYNGAYKALKARAGKLLGPEGRAKFHPHLLRHEFVSEILRSTGNLKLAQDLARHVNIQTTQRYAHLAEDDIEQSHHEIFNAHKHHR